MYELLRIIAISLLTQGQPYLADVDHHINVESNRIIICLNGWCIDSESPHADEEALSEPNKGEEIGA